MKKSVVAVLAAFLLLSLSIGAQAGRVMTGDAILYSVADGAVRGLNEEFSVSKIDKWYDLMWSRVKRLEGKQNDFRGKPVLTWQEGNEFAQVLRRMKSLARDVVDLQARIKKDEKEIKWKPELKSEIESLKRQVKPKRDKLFALRDSLSGLRDAIKAKGLM